MSMTLIPEISTLIPSLSWLYYRLLPRSCWFNPRPIHVGFVVDKVTLVQVVLKYFTFFLLIIIRTTSHKNNPCIGLSYQLTVSVKRNRSVF